mmetsp:Transcript_4447/g.13265  ORF Transcript_4447/g.13265 Transcript_4447/m.13265 type:complete len:218 (-) Transcript_4447:659-1312(-)
MPRLSLQLLLESTCVFTSNAFCMQGHRAVFQEDHFAEVIPLVHDYFTRFVERRIQDQCKLLKLPSSQRVKDWDLGEHLHELPRGDDFVVVPPKSGGECFRGESQNGHRVRIGYNVALMHSAVQKGILAKVLPFSPGLIGIAPFHSALAHDKEDVDSCALVHNLVTVVEGPLDAHLHEPQQFMVLEFRQKGHLLEQTEPLVGLSLGELSEHSAGDPSF